MRLSTAVLSSVLAALASASSCSLENGNYYCSSVSAVLYENVGYSGSYSDVTNMDEDSCTCTQESVSFSGTNSPLDEELSVHFRGPVKLLQFGVYYPSSSSSSTKRKRDADADCQEVKHVHHAHKREAAVEIVEVTQTVYVDSNGNLITASETTTSTQAGAQTTSDGTNTAQATTTLLTSLVNAAVSTTASPTSTSTSTSSTSTSSPTSTSYTSTKSSSSSSSSSSTKTSSSATSTSTGSSGAWSRSSYYTPGSVSNVTFLNTLGGVTSSGIWSSCFGNSLSYAAANGVDASSSAVALNEVTLASDDEYIIFSGSSCDDGDGCGYYRSDIPAYHGFGGAEKIFVFEFEMPHDSSSSSASNPDMPAIWLLNAKIPRTLQYGDSSCSCWSTGCGELDLFEILSEGDERLISHIHDGQGNDGTSSGGGGSQDYFTRPTDSSLKAAVIFSSDGTIQIAALDDDADFGSSLSSSTVESWLSITGGTASLS